MKLPTVLAGTPGANLPLLLGLVGAAAVGLVVAVVVCAAVHYRRGGPWDQREYRKLAEAQGYRKLAEALAEAQAEAARKAARGNGHVRSDVQAENQKGHRRDESGPRTDAEGGSGGFPSPT